MNKGTRLSEFIDDTQARNLADAIQFAWIEEHPLDVAIAIHLGKGRVTVRPQKFIEKFLKYAGQWLRLRDVGRHYVWVLENPEDGGLNVHMMVHWPKEHRPELGKRLRHWLKLAGGRNSAKVLKCQNLRQPGDRQGNGFGPWKGRYRLKGASPAFCAAWGIKFESQGPIKGKRTGTSETIGKAARDKSAFPRLPPSILSHDGEMQEVQHVVLGFRKVPKMKYHGLEQNLKFEEFYN
jgi:hypothetical protein